MLVFIITQLNIPQFLEFQPKHTHKEFLGRALKQTPEGDIFNECLAFNS